MFPGGNRPEVDPGLTEAIGRLISEYGPEAVAHVAVKESLVMPYDRRQQELDQAAGLVFDPRILTSSRYGTEFDLLANRWATVENEHDKIHPDRGRCGGVGGCSMMFTANRLESEMIEILNDWRPVPQRRLPSTPERTKL